MTRIERVCLDGRFGRVAPVGEHDHITRLDVRRGVLDQAEVVAGGVVEAVGRHQASVAAGTWRWPLLVGRASSAGSVSMQECDH